MVECILLPEPWGKALGMFCSSVYLHILIEHSTACFARLRYPGFVPTRIIRFCSSSPTVSGRHRINHKNCSEQAPTTHQPPHWEIPRHHQSSPQSCRLTSLFSPFNGETEAQRLVTCPMPHMNEWQNRDSDLHTPSSKACVFSSSAPFIWGEKCT